MKKLIVLLSTVTVLASCHDMDLNPLSQGSTESWYSTETEITMSLNDLYRDAFWPMLQERDEAWADDWCYRQTLNEISNGSINSEWSIANNTYWLNTYKAISRTNTIIENLGRLTGAPEATIKRIEAEARFIRAAQYARLIFYFGDVVWIKQAVTLEEAFAMGRTAKATVIPEVYADFDFAAEHLPAEYSKSEAQRATKGAALALKARMALCEGDWATARDAARACIDLGKYSLHTDYSSLFMPGTKTSSEFIFTIPRSVELNITFGTQNIVPRNRGGWGAFCPSWDLLAAYLCTDGLPIDESPLFDSHDPFKNRDPRCNMTIVPFQTMHLGYMYQPHPDSLNVIGPAGTYVKNNDTRANAEFASFNGLLWKKGVDASYYAAGWKGENSQIQVRYADVLLMYAEAKIELNDIDQSVIDAMNKVRARAYGVDYTDAAAYPSVTTLGTDQASMRKTLRIERRMEFALECRRYTDIIRWRLAEKTMHLPNYRMLTSVTDLRTKVVNTGGWFWPETPPIDDDGVADFSIMAGKGLIDVCAQRLFDKQKQYLWPIPAKDILINENMKQNPGY